MLPALPLRLFLIVAAASVLLTGCDRVATAVEKVRERVNAPRENVDSKERDEAAALTTVEDPVAVDARSFRRAVADAFQGERFEVLEKLVAGLRGSREVLPNGSWKIVQFYSAFDGDDREPETLWKQRDARHRAWIEAHPRSAAARVAYAAFLTDYAWFARGSGYANTVTAEGWRLFAERLRAAREQLESAKGFPDRDIYWWRAAMTVALGQGWDAADFDALVEEAHGVEPEFWGDDVARAYSLLPRWHGEPGDWEAFALKAAARPDGLGDELYARIVLGQSGFYDNVFRESRAQWPKAKAGLDLLRAKYPDSLEILSGAAFLATCAQDRPYAQAAFDALGDRYVRGYWPSRESFVHYRNWARTGQW